MRPPSSPLRARTQEIERLELRRKRRGGVTPLRPYGWESVEMQAVPAMVRDLANQGTLSERR